MAGIDRLCEVMGCDNDLDEIERDKLCAVAAGRIEKQARQIEELLSYLNGISRQTAAMVKANS